MIKPRLRKSGLIRLCILCGLLFVLPSSVSDIYAASNPTVRSYPIMASALAPTYALPVSVGMAKLRLSVVTLCKMQRGAILYWSCRHTTPHFTALGEMVPAVMLSRTSLNPAHVCLSVVCVCCVRALWFCAHRNDTEIQASNPSLVLPFVPVTWSVQRREITQRGPAQWLRCPLFAFCE